ncbi:MAG: VanW family protein [Clostridiales bacterium]|nr:VanW family protein [Clostridiales bacterium]
MSDIMRKFLSALLALCIGMTVMPVCLRPVLAEDVQTEGEEVTGEEARDAEGENTEDATNTGLVYEEKTKEDFDANSPALYIGKFSNVFRYSIFSEKNVKSKKLARDLQNDSVEILYVGLVWVIVRYNGIIGYVKREYLSKDMTTVDPEHTAPFNVQKHQYIATVAKECYVRKSMSKEPLEEKELDTYWVKLNPGTRISIWQFMDGWAVVNYMRSYGYIDPNDLTDLIPVSPTTEPLSEDSPIAAYTSYYTMKHLKPGASKDTKELNLNRIWNIGHGCEKIRETGLLQPGDIFDANKKNIGPYREYKQAIGLVDGKAVRSSGGGTCQVSSTLYNIIIQMPGLTILKRRPHGYGGASYLPIHCDAAVGNDALNFIFRNDYDFPIRLEGYSSGDGALLMLAYRAD